MILMKKIRKCVLGAGLLLVLNFPALSHFDGIESGARSSGMGSAGPAFFPSAESIPFNPAGLAYIKAREFTSAYSRLLMGLTDGSQLSKGFVSFALPLGDEFGVGAAWNSFFLKDYYWEDTGYLSIGGSIYGKLAGGVSLKLFRKRYGLTAYTENKVDLITGQVSAGVNPVFAGGYSQHAFSADAGLLYLLTPADTLGVSFRNILKADLALNPDDRDTVPFSVTVGYRKDFNNLSIIGDFISADEDMGINIGVESEILSGVSFRGGYGFGSRNYKRLSLGASFVHDEIFRIDYAFSYPLLGIRDTYGTHRVGMGMLFGEPEKPVDEESERENRRQRALVASNLRIAQENYTAGKYEVAKENLLAVLNVEPKNEPALRLLGFVNQSLISVYFSEANRHYQENNFSEALKYIEMIMDIDPEHRLAIGLLRRIE